MKPNRLIKKAAIEAAFLQARFIWRRLAQRTDKIAIARATSHPTTTSAATAPAVILSFSFVV
jgi:hypothetical protein